MAGVKQFNRNEVLDRAMEVFWRYGYQATSIQDLVEATGVNRGSLYTTFGDKCGLFIAVLDHYSEHIARPTMAELSNPDPRRAIEGMLESIVRRNCNPAWPNGCLDTNTALECPGLAMILDAKSRNWWASRRRRFIRFCAALRMTGRSMPNRMCVRWRGSL